MSASSPSVSTVCLLAWALGLVCLAGAEEMSKDDMWNLLNRDSAVRRLAKERPPGSPLDTALEAEQELDLAVGSKLALGALMAADKEAWPEANLRFEFGAGWRCVPVPLGKDIVHCYSNGGDLTAIISFVPMVRGETLPVAELLKGMDVSAGKKFTDIKPVEAEGRAKELGMLVTEGRLALPGGGDKATGWVGRWLRDGGLYALVVLGPQPAAVRAEFGRLLGTFVWIEDGKDLRVPPVAELTVPGAGFSVPCAQALMREVKPQLPGGVAGAHLHDRLELMALDLKGIDLPLSDVTTALLKMLAVSESGNYRLEETVWAGQPALLARPKRPETIFGQELDWRMQCAVRDGWLCVALAVWSTGNDAALPAWWDLVGHAVFTPPAGEPRAVASEDEGRFAAVIYNEIGLKAFTSGRHNAAAKAFERALILNPKDPTLVLNLANALTEQGRVRQALEAVEKYGKPFPEHEGIRLWHAGLLAKVGRAADAVPIYEELFEGGLRDTTELSVWIGALQVLGRHERAVEVARTVFGEGHQLQWQRILANSLWTAGKLEEARGQFRELATELGEEEGFVSDHASLLLELKDYKAVLDLLGGWEKTREPSTGMRFSKGMAQIGLGWFKDAVATFTRLDELVPGNQTVKEALGQAQAMLGQGSLEGFRDELKAVALPPDLTQHAAAALAKCQPAKDFPGEGWVVLQDARVWEWREGTDAKVTQYRRIRVLDASGVAAFATIFLPFRPTAERINIHRMTVTDAEGREIASFRKEELYVRDAGGGTADGAKILCLPMPALKEGALIELDYTKSLVGTADRMPLVADGISESSALVYGAVAFTGELEKIRFAQTDRLAPGSGDAWRGYEGEQFPRRRGEGDLPPADRWGLLCWAADQRFTWEGEARDYRAEIHDCLAADGFAEGVVKELELADKPPAEVVRAVVRWLNKKFQYQGLEFGRRARMPAKGELTLGRGFGDCKDLSVMVRAVLLKAGVRAELALVNSGGVLRQDVPSLDQFDHMLLHLPDLGGAFLDPTARYFNTPEALPAQLVGCQALVLEGAAPRFVTMAEPAAAERTATIEREVKIDPASGEAACHETVTLSPARATGFRYGFSATPVAEHLKAIESILRRREPRLSVKSVRFHALEDPFEPLGIELEYFVPGAFHLEAGVWVGSAPGAIERTLFETERERDRNLGILIRTPDCCTVRSRIVPPAGFVWLAPEPLEQTAAAPGACEGKVSWQADPAGILMVGGLKVSPCSGDVALYDRIQAANESIFRLWAERVRFKKE